MWILYHLLREEKGPGSMALVVSTHAVGFFYTDVARKNAGKAGLSPLTD
jgi:hypothetical protein